MKVLAGILFIGALPLAGPAQELPVNTAQQLEQLADLGETDPDDALLVQLDALRRNPINLNKAGASDLELFPFLSALQVAQFISYRTRLGALIDLHELQAVPGWDPLTIRLLLPYITLQEEADMRKRIATALKGEHLLLVRTSRTLQKAAGYRNGSFAGDANHLLGRYLYRSPGRLQAGITAEKDAGEPLMRKGRTGPDFLSAHLFVRGKGKLKALALGDFTANLGQGLVHWQGLAFGKGPEVMAVKRQSAVLRPYAASGEFLFLRGAGLSVGSGKWEASLFGARQRVHGNTGFNDWGQRVITSFSPSGLHRTASEFADRKAVGQWVGGGTLQYRNKLFRSGINGVWHRFDLPLEKRDEPYNLYAPRGQQFFNVSADYGWTVRNIHLFGEAAIDYKGRPALVQGALLSAHRWLDISLVGRYLHPGYVVLSGNAFTEAATPGNEVGIYAGMQWRPAARWRMGAYADFYRSPWLRFRVDGPGYGSDYLVQLHWQPSKREEGYLLWRTGQKTANDGVEGEAFRLVGQRSRHSLRVQWGHRFPGGGQWRSRAEWVRSQTPGGALSKGLLLFADIQFAPRKDLDLDLRLAWFQTDDFNSRIYAYEQDVLYSYSIPALWGKGIRSYGNLRWQWQKSCSFWLRVGHTWYPGQSLIGSGLTSIEGSHRTDLRIQVVVRF